MNHKALVIASLAGDALALAAHWIYDQAKIEQQFGRIRTLQAPQPDSYHKNKSKGSFTHYGDQTFWLLKSLAAHDGFSASRFARDWYQNMESYEGYLDKASKETFSNMRQSDQLTGCGSKSADLGGAARIAPLVFRYYNKQEKLLEAVRKQTAITHNNQSVLAGAEALARITCYVLAGCSPTEAVQETLADGIPELDIDMKIRGGLDSAGKNTAETLKSFGLACGISAALPGVIHLIASYENDLETALVENVMAGGDSAARGLAVGMILGASNGLKALPLEWLSDMRACEEVMAILETEPDRG